MKIKSFFAVLALMCASTANAQEENTIYISQDAPLATGSTARQRLYVEMTNTYTNISGIQFEIHFPEGISLYNMSKPYSLPATRYPYNITYEYDDETGEDVEKKTNKFDAQWVSGAEEEDPYEGFAIYTSPDQNGNFDYVLGNSGRLMVLQVAVDASMSPGVYPIRLSKIALACPVDDKIPSVDLLDVACYVVVGQPTIDNVDLSGAKGFMPAGVVNSLNTLLNSSADMKSVDLSNVTDANVVLSPTNPNALIYTKEGSEFAIKQEAALTSNVVVGDLCSSLSLTDGHPFHAPKAFTAASAEYVRTVPADGWYSLVLPFAADTEATVERYQSLDLDNNVINFATGSIEADVPCIFQAQAGDVTFTATNAPVAVTPAELKDDCVLGFYSAQQAGSIEGSLALRADGTGFGTATANATVAPFRSIVSAPAATRALRLVHNNETDGIAAMRDSQTTHAYTLNGLRDNLQTPGLHIADGKKIITK